jgi:4'-phosphopantetheinyl transferase EntD
MLARCTTPIAVALATADDLPDTMRARPDTERRVSRIAARRAIRLLAGDDVTIDLRRRLQAPPIARIRRGPADRETVAVGVTHRDGLAAAIAAPNDTLIGIDIERLDAADPTHRRFYLTSNEQKISTGYPDALLWAFKEAAWKALHLDDSVAFHDLELELNNTGVTSMTFRGTRYRAASAMSTPWAGYVMAALVLELQ